MLNHSELTGALVAHQVFVLADTSYNSEGVDEVAAQHIGGDCIVSSLPLATRPLSCLSGRSASSSLQASTAPSQACEQPEHARQHAEHPMRTDEAKFACWTLIFLLQFIVCMHVTV